MKILFSLFSISILISCYAWGTPAQVVLIRHAEKLATGGEVNRQGCERAYLLPNFFLNNPIVEQFGAPVATYAVAPNHAYSAVRAIQTIAPTAQALRLQVLDPATRLQYSLIVQQIMSNPNYDGKTVLIAWEHKAIPGLAEAFGATLSSDMKKWPGKVFDEAWILDFAGAPTPSVQIIAEDVLPNDNPDGGTNWKNPPASLNSDSGIPQQIVNECADNSALNKLVAQITNPPPAIYFSTRP